MNWFFDQVTYGTAVCDYKVSRFYNTKNRSFEGARIIAVLVHFNNGDKVTEYWDGKSRVKERCHQGFG